MNGNEWPQSTKPFRTNPPEGTVGLVIPMRDNLKFFKLAYHSVLDFTDHRYMLTIVDNMSQFTTRQYLDSLRRNHQVNILSYQKDHDLTAEIDLAMRFMFSFSQVKYGCVVLPYTVVEPNWLSRMVRALNATSYDALTPIFHPNGTEDKPVFLFKREAYEKAGNRLPENIGTCEIIAHRFSRAPQVSA